jgi:hypothetical protein
MYNLIKYQYEVLILDRFGLQYINVLTNPCTKDAIIKKIALDTHKGKKEEKTILRNRFVRKVSIQIGS